MKKIVLHGPAIDGAGNYCDAGTELEIADEPGEGSISAEDAKALVDGGRAVSLTAEKKIKKGAQDKAGGSEEAPGGELGTGAEGAGAGAAEGAGDKDGPE